MNKNKMHVGADASARPTSKARQNRGITLIALIITIIVMLILVAVTINMAVNGGLFEKAGQAVGEMQNAVNKEQELSNGKIEIGGVWYDSIDDYINGIPSSVHNWTRTGDTFTCSHCNTTYEMGQVVNYTPAGKTSTTLSAEMSGLEDDEGVANGVSFSTNGKVEDYTINLLLDEKENGELVKLESAPSAPTGTQTIEVQDSAWIVLGIEDTDGNGTYETLLITTAYLVGATADEYLWFYGAAAYNNGPSEINRICEELYSNSEYGKARGMTIEDVNRTLNYTPHGGEYADSEWNYYTTGNLTTKLKDIPTWDNIKGNHQTPDGTNTEEALGDYELNGYYYYLNDEANGLINDVNDTTTSITEVEKNTIFGASADYNYWLASRGVGAGSDCAFFGPGSVFCDRAFSSGDLFISNGGEHDSYAGLRPVVSLRSKLPEVLSTITFTIGGETFWALEKMTWSEWANSNFCPYEDFNIPDYFESSDSGRVDVSSDDVIRSGGIYNYVHVIQ